MRADAQEMIAGDPGAENARAYDIIVQDAGRLSRLPALLIELGVPPGRLSEELGRHTSTVRIRPRTPNGQPALDTLTTALAEQPGDAAQTVARGQVLCAPRAAIESAARGLANAGLPRNEKLAAELAEALRAAREPLPLSTHIRSRHFAWGQRTYVMGILNVTPDSFSGDGTLVHGNGGAAAQAAVERALELEAEGADILDIGAESTRPGAAEVSAADEIARLIPVLAAVRRRTDIPISVDTFKSETARAALAEGADLINDVRGLAGDPAMAGVAREAGVPVVLMHNRLGTRAVRHQQMGGRYVGVRYRDLLLDVIGELADLRDAAVSNGIPASRILLDPGLGFGKTVAQSLALVDRCGELRSLGQPLLLGPSRKSFVGYTLGLPPDQRVYGTVASIAVAIARGGADMARVHDVRAAVEAVRIVDAIAGATARGSIGE